MATVTHGGTLPDTSDKADFYAIIDNATVQSIVNADIAAGAAIVDTKLATIVTASKVNVSAITGQLPNTNIAQITASAKVSGAALTLLPNIPAGAGIIPVANIGGILGSWTAKSSNTVYQAATDGLVVFADETTGGTGVKWGLSDSNNPPTTRRACCGMDSSTYTSGCFPVKKNDYYKIDGSVYWVYFIPLGA